MVRGVQAVKIRSSAVGSLDAFALGLDSPFVCVVPTTRVPPLWGTVAPNCTMRPHTSCRWHHTEGLYLHRGVAESVLNSLTSHGCGRIPWPHFWGHGKVIPHLSTFRGLGTGGWDNSDAASNPLMAMG